MKVQVTQPVEIDVKAVIISVPVHYEDEDIPYDFPLRKGDMWEAIVNIETGRIYNWPEGKTGEMYMKVTDSGSYILLDELDREVARLDDYVPHGLIPGEYGDYLQLDINESGIITNWPKPEDIDLDAFFLIRG